MPTVRAPSWWPVAVVAAAMTTVRRPMAAAAAMSWEMDLAVMELARTAPVQMEQRCL